MSTDLSCKKCGKEFSEERYLKQHMNRRVPCTKKFICPRCKKEFSRGTNLRTHLSRKNPCVPKEVPVITKDNEENRCQYCNNTYASKSNLRRHIKTCSTKNNPNVLLQLLAEKEKVINLQQQLLDNGISPQTVINNNVTVNQVQQNLHVNHNMYVNVTICSFGKEDLSRLDTSKVMKLLKGQIEDFMPRMIEHVHANPDHPEFHNVFYDPRREKAIVFAPTASGDQMTWHAQDFSEISKQITDKIKEHIRPGAGPYFDDAMRLKDTETANKIIQLSNEVKYDSPEALEQSKSSLSQVTKNQGFLEQVQVIN